MNRTVLCWIRRALSLGLPISLWAQSPTINPHGVVNSGSFRTPGLPGSGIAQGSIFTIFGSGIGPGAGVQVSSFPLGPTFSGVSIQATQGATSVAVLPLYVSSNQINALMPSDAPLGWVSLRVTYNKALSNASPVFVVRDSPGFYTATGTGMGPGAIHNIAADGTKPTNSNQASAKPGQTLEAFLTGLGPIASPDNSAPPAGTLPTQVELWVGGVPVPPASIIYSGRSPCCSGLDQIDFVVPASAPRGCWVPVEIRTSGANIGSSVTIAIDPQGAPCSDPSNPLSASIVKGGAIGALSLGRTTVHQDVGVNAPLDVVGDSLTYTASKQAGGPFAFTPFNSAPPAGTCAVYKGTGDYWTTNSVVDSTVRTTLDPGTQFKIASSSAAQTATLSNGSAVLGSLLPLYALTNTALPESGELHDHGQRGRRRGRGQRRDQCSQPTHLDQSRSNNYGGSLATIDAELVRSSGSDHYYPGREFGSAY